MNDVYLLPMRFRLRNDAPFYAVKVAVFDYPYQVIKKVQDAVQVERNKKFSSGEYPPLRQLGSVLSVLVPGLVHSFYYDNYSGRTKSLTAISSSYPEDFTEEERHQPLLTLGDDMDWLPPTWKIFEVIETWIRLWLNQKSLGLNELQIDRLFSNFRHDLDSLAREGYDWKIVSLDTLLNSRDPKVYNTLPALLTSLLAYITKDTPAELEGLNFTWHLAQDYDRTLHLLSPVQAGPGGSSFAYNLEFSVQNYAGSQENWIYLHAHVQRYNDSKNNKPVWLNTNRGATVYFSKLYAFSGWENHFRRGIYTQLGIKWGKNSYIWKNDVPHLLAALKLRDPLITPSALLSSPQTYRNPGLEQDSYRLVYSEGMGPNHPMETGLSMDARRQVTVMVSRLLKDWLVPDNVIPKDNAIFNAKIPFTLREFDTVAKRDEIRKTQRNEKLSDTEKLDQIDRIATKTRGTLYTATRRAFGLSNTEKVYVLVCWHRKATRNLLIEKLRWLYNLDHTAINPEVLEIIDLEIDHTLIKPLHFEKDLEGDAIARQRKAERDSRYKAWNRWVQKQLQTYHIDSEKSPCVALVELPEGSDDEKNALLQIKGMIRAGFVKNRVATQMFMPIPVNQEVESGEANRAENAVMDLLLRQPGAVFTEARTFFTNKHVLGDSDTARNLHVTAIHRERSTTYGVDYPVAIRWYPDGRMMAKLPKDASWDLLWRVTLRLGQRFTDAANTDINQLKLSDEDLRNFLIENITDLTKHPNLVIIDAATWRSVWKQLLNYRLSTDTLDFGNGQVYSPQTLPLTRVVRLRQQGTLMETPQYIALKGKNWEIDDVDEMEEFVSEETPDSDGVDEITSETKDKSIVFNFTGTYASGFIDETINRESPLYHYCSIAQMPQTVHKLQYKVNIQSPKHDKVGGKIPYKHQSIVELIPFFLFGDDGRRWSQLVSLMRSTPAWKQGHIILPYPLHLGANMIDDMLDVFYNY